MRVLDLGCGTGRDLSPWGVGDTDYVTGIDIDDRRLMLAQKKFPQHSYLHGAGEHLPLPDQSFDRVISAVAIPYMNIQQTLGEIHRVLVPGGTLSLSLHLPSFTVTELQHALPRPVPTIYRLYVISNGLLFHATGKTLGFLRRRTESFQTERGMRLALSRAGFVDLSFRRGRGPAGETFTVDARKPHGLASADAA